MNEVTFGIAVLLATGLLFAKLAQLIRLPSVTGFILAGLVLGPSGFGLLTMESVGHRLDHFTQIALMLIAFGIGEHIEIRKLGNVARDVGYISVVQAIGAFVLVAAGTLATTLLLSGPEGIFREQLTLALLLGAVAVATAPAAILHVVRELGARGPLTATLMAVVAVDDGLAIIIFGMAVSAAHQLAGQGGGSVLTSILASFAEIGFSIAIGIATGLVIDVVLHKLHNREEMLTAGLALLLICGETTRMLHLSPLLAGMMAGFILINRAERDVRLFRAINGFEPPIYVLFFTLAGVHLDIAALKSAGWIGLVYVVARIIGKYCGSWLGGVLSGAPSVVKNYLGLALIPQAGVAIGLVFMIASDPKISQWSTIITPIVLAGVVLSELIGPLLVRHTLEKGNEAKKEQLRPECQGRPNRLCNRWLKGPEGVSLSPWEEESLHPATNAEGVVVFGACHAATARALSRIATILAHHYHALPMSVRVLNKSEKGMHTDKELEAMFLPERDEAGSLGYPLLTEIIYDEPASGLVSATEYNNAQAVVLGYPLGRKPLVFQKVLDRVAANVLCPVIAVRFVGALTCKRILVPFLFPQELEELLPLCEAFATASQPRITFLQMLHADCSRQEIMASETQLQQWLEVNLVDVDTSIRVESSDSRLETVLNAVRYHDLIIMTAARRHKIQRMFFGSLANSVVHNCKKPVFVVYTPQAGLIR
jgi:Kef-type K+ transport system membrane component KefB/nucleotide-binding universal stress UspA family protein